MKTSLSWVVAVLVTVASASAFAVESPASWPSAVSEKVADWVQKKIAAGEKWTLEHLVALINGGANVEANLSVTCCWCLPAKNAEDVAEKSRTYRKRSKHLGLRKSSRPLAGSKASGWHKHMDGTVSRRTT